MTRTLLFTLLLACGAAEAEAQFSLGLRVGMERYALGEVRSWQEDELERIRYRVPAEAVGAFPAYLAIGVEAAVATGERSRVGLVLRQGSTGGRIRYTDRTGDVRADWQVRRLSAGLLGEVGVARSGPYTFLFGVHALVDFGRLRYENALVLGDVVLEETAPDPATARTYSVEPEVGVERQFGRVGARLRMGFGLSSSGKATLIPDRTIQDGNVVYPIPGLAPDLEWTGWRLGLSLVYHR